MKYTIAAVVVSGFLIVTTTTTTPLSAGVNVVGQFIGEFHDTFDQYNNVNATASLPAFDGHGSIVRVGTSGSIKTEFSSQLNGDLVLPMSDMMIGQLCIANWVFNQPAYRFGGFWETTAGRATPPFAFTTRGMCCSTRSSRPCRRTRSTGRGTAGRATCRFRASK